MSGKLKRLILALLAAAMLLSIAGCSGASSSSEETAPSEEPEMTLDVFWRGNRFGGKDSSSSAGD